VTLETKVGEVEGDGTCASLLTIEPSFQLSAHTGTPRCAAAPPREPDILPDGEHGVVNLSRGGQHGIPVAHCWPAPGTSSAWTRCGWPTHAPEVGTKVSSAGRGVGNKLASDREENEEIEQAEFGGTRTVWRRIIARTLSRRNHALLQETTSEMTPAPALESLLGEKERGAFQRSEGGPAPRLPTLILTRKSVTGQPSLQVVSGRS